MHPFIKPVLFLLAAAVIAQGAETPTSAPVTLESLLSEMVDPAAAAQWPELEYTSKETSSYDRRKVGPNQPNWFANHDHTEFIREEEYLGRREKVMMDADGPGAIVRFWVTGRQKNGVIRIYLDGNSEPAITTSSFDLLDSPLNVGAPLAQPHPGYSPAFGGNTLYLPIPYARHCKVTWEEKAKGARYYQINYRTYAPGTVVKTFSKDQLETAKSRIAETNQKLNNPPKAKNDGTPRRHRLQPGGEAVINLPNGPAAVRNLSLAIPHASAAQMERNLRDLIVKIEFDDELCVWCPASDFFGSGVGLNALQNVSLEVSPSGNMQCRWVMPYAKSARLTLINLGKQPQEVTLWATTSPWVWNQRSMHFHAAWHFQDGLTTPPPSDWNFIQIKGRGVYIGDTLALVNAKPTWYGEGDEKIWVDGESFPSHMGTGTEDYYGYSFAPRGVFQTAFTNQVRIDQPKTQGHNVMNRVRRLDAIPFQRSLQFDIELISWKPTTLTYAATTYWYAMPGAVSNIKPQPEAAVLPIPTLAEIQRQAAAEAAAPAPAP